MTGKTSGAGTEAGTLYESYFNEARFRRDHRMLTDEERRVYKRHLAIDRVTTAFWMGIVRMLMVLVAMTAIGGLAYWAWLEIAALVEEHDAPIGIEIRMIYPPHPTA